MRGLRFGLLRAQWFDLREWPLALAKLVAGHAEALLRIRSDRAVPARIVNVLAPLRLADRHTRFLAMALLAGLLAGVTWHQKAVAADYSDRVTDQQGKPTAKARVEVNGEGMFSKPDGTFQVSVPPHERWVLHISHPNFADLAYILRTPLAGQTWRLVRAPIQTVDAKNEITLKDKRPELKKKKIGGAT